jgi:hypothetical protein
MNGWRDRWYFCRGRAKVKHKTLKKRNALNRSRLRKERNKVFISWHYASLHPKITKESKNWAKIASFKPTTIENTIIHDYKRFNFK